MMNVRTIGGGHYSPLNHDDERCNGTVAVVARRAG
eukprot:CAMPEP_0194686618 /NCGR_PEP_ID=MMETSP0295-20121207/15623_1 /TAXON_ID=39354 /ORGANISM="Heterosigma akashiwo, Strain CCMP2393" /LENGTH=34 /DNA_ID= /DNA_START= /DNA_END= /DNA_ORIENTATION=